MNRQARAAPQFPQADRLKLAAVVTAPTCARLFVRRVCQRWAIPEEQAGTAELLASEMITNSVEATGTLKPDPGYLVIHGHGRGQDGERHYLRRGDRPERAGGAGAPSCWW